MTQRSPHRILATSTHPQGTAWIGFLRKTALAHLRTLEVAACELSLSLVTDRQIRRLNREWRAKDKATDVLSFGLPALPGPARGARVLGDIVISLDTARRQATLNQQTLKQELARYLAHGLLHLLGHDHHRVEPRRKMAALEEKLLGKPGLIPSGKMAVRRARAVARVGSADVGPRTGRRGRPAGAVGARKRVTR